MPSRALLPLILLFSLLLGSLDADAKILVKLSSNGGPVRSASGGPPMAPMPPRSGPAKPDPSLPTLSLPGRGWRYLPGVDLYIVEEGDETLRSLERTGGLEAVESEREIVLESLPNDPMVSELDWLPGGAGVDIGALEAWGLATGGPEVTVALIDTGIDTDHPDLQGNLWVNEDEMAGNGIDDDGNGFVDDRNGFDFRLQEADVEDENGHGSHIAGVIGAVGNNGIGVVGVNWQVRLMPLKFTDPHGNGNSAVAVEAIDYAIRNGADVINASWTVKQGGGEGGGGGEDGLLREAIRRAGEAGILFVAAAGNQLATGIGLDIDESPIYPARFSLENLIAVAAADEGGDLAPYSNYGRESVDLVAPGEGILSTASAGGYGSMSGTSVAAAFVSGAAALLLSVDPTLSPAGIKSILRETVTREEVLEDLVSSGGRLDVGRAISGLVENPPSEAPGSSDPSANGPASNLSAPSGGCSMVSENR